MIKPMIGPIIATVFRRPVNISKPFSQSPRTYSDIFSHQKIFHCICSSSTHPRSILTSLPTQICAFSFCKFHQLQLVPLYVLGYGLAQSMVNPSQATLIKKTYSPSSRDYQTQGWDFVSNSCLHIGILSTLNFYLFFIYSRLYSIMLYNVFLYFLGI